MDISLSQFFEALGSKSGWAVLVLLLYMLTIGRQLMLRADHIDVIATRQKASDDLLAATERFYQDRLADMAAQLERSRTEGDGWKEMALTGTGVLVDVARALPGPASPPPASPHRGGR